MDNSNTGLAKAPPLLTLDVSRDVDSYFLAKHVIASGMPMQLPSPMGDQSARTSTSHGSGRRQSAITNLVIPSYLINSVSGSAHFSSADSENRRRQSVVKRDPKEQFDAQAFARKQSTAVLTALDAKPPRLRPSIVRRNTDFARVPEINTMTSIPQAYLGSQAPQLAPLPPRLATLHLNASSNPRPSLATRREHSRLVSSGIKQDNHAPELMRHMSVSSLAVPTVQLTRPAMNRKKSVAFRLNDDKETIREDAHAESEAVSSPVVALALTQVDPALLRPSIDYFGHYSFNEEVEIAVRQRSTAHGPLDLTGSAEVESASLPEKEEHITERRSSMGAPAMARRHTMWQRSKSVWHDTVDAVAGGVQHAAKRMHKSAMEKQYDNAISRRVALQRSKTIMILFEWTIYLLLLAVVYFVFVGLPLWEGAVYWTWYAIKHRLEQRGVGTIITGLAFFYAFSPLLVFFEPDAPLPDEATLCESNVRPGVEDTCLLIPCYKSENIIGPTLRAAIEIFPPSHIFVIANGNSTTPLDETEAVCTEFGVNHIWSPVGSKIVAQFVGCYAAKGFKNVLLIDDDCALPSNFPVVSNQLKGKVHCMGYTIKSVGCNSSRGTFAQQAQDMEYKLSGLQRLLAGKLGSVLFPHGAISLWNREFLISTFHQHPGFNVSEDWFFGHVARELGCRTKMCTSVFVETETPSSVFLSSGGARGGFGEMTVFKQRFTRWNFFFVNGIYYNLKYILFSWKLGRYEIFTKVLCFQEIYETLVYLATPLLLPVTFWVRPLFCTYVLLAIFGLYFLNVIIFNELHLRRKNERVATLVVYLYYMPYKIILFFVNVASCYYALVRYATYFAKRHPKVVEDERAIGVVLQLEESVDDGSISTSDLDSPNKENGDLPSPISLAFLGATVEEKQRPRLGRRMTVTAIGAQTQLTTADTVVLDGVDHMAPKAERSMTVTTMGPRIAEVKNRPLIDSSRLSISIPPMSRRISGMTSPASAATAGGRYPFSNQLSASSPVTIGSVLSVHTPRSGSGASKQQHSHEPAVDLLYSPSMYTQNKAAESPALPHNKAQSRSTTLAETRSTQQLTPRSDSVPTRPTPTRLFSVAEVTGDKITTTRLSRALTSDDTIVANNDSTHRVASSSDAPGSRCRRKSSWWWRRGRGDSSALPPPQQQSVSDAGPSSRLLAQLAAVRAKLALERVEVVGWDMEGVFEAVDDEGEERAGDAV